jgi:2-polyprenyl-6-hydroxyphenyl methylase/3-demethylubiquinone-9 3-methyltransferase
MAYYDENLAGERLRRCYRIAPPRVQQYLQAEIDHVAARLGPHNSVLELGCGYGRVAIALADAAARVVGIDTASESIELARQLAGGDPRCEFLVMDATAPAFRRGVFDAVVCVQNGICAFGVDRVDLVREAARVCRRGGRILFSSYADAFWPHRLQWFELQAVEGLVGDIDYDATGDGMIVCRDGFRAGFMRPADFERLWIDLGLEPHIAVVDSSSVFCESVIA